MNYTDWARYRQGYFKALIDIHHYFTEVISEYLEHSYKGANRAKVMLAIIKMLLNDKKALDWFMHTGGLIDGHIVIQEKTGKKSKEYIAMYEDRMED